MNLSSNKQKIEGLYDIDVKTVQGTVLNFHYVNGYSIEPGDIISFVDSKTKKIKRFHTSNVEIKEVQQ